MMVMVSFPFAWNITGVLPRVGSVIGAENSWMLYVFGTLVLGILIGGLVKGIARLILGMIILSGFALLFLIFMQKKDTISMIASVVFGVILLVFSFIIKTKKPYSYVKR